MVYFNHVEKTEDKIIDLLAWVLVSLYFEEVEI